MAENIYQTKARIDENDVMFRNIDRMFLVGGNIEDAVRIIEELTVIHGITLADITFKKKAASGISSEYSKSGEAGQDLFILPVSAHIVGVYDNFKVFLDRIQKTLPLVGVSSMAISSSSELEESSENPLFIFKMDFKLFSLE